MTFESLIRDVTFANRLIKFVDKFTDICLFEFLNRISSGYRVLERRAKDLDLDYFTQWLK